jgi:hypothetical protein
VDIELKIEAFQPEHFGKLQFYLEALDRDVKKPHENASVGLLLCATRNQEVVKYALSRSASPAMVAQYQTTLPEKKLLQAKLHEFYSMAEDRVGSRRRKKSPPSSRSQKSSRTTTRQKPVIGMGVSFGESKTTKKQLKGAVGTARRKIGARSRQKAR